MGFSLSYIYLLHVMAFFLLREGSNIYFKVDFVLNSFSFFFVFVSPSILNDNSAGQILGCRFFPFRTLNISCHHSLLQITTFLQKNQLIALWVLPCINICFCISLAVFRILSLTFAILIIYVFLQVYLGSSFLGSSVLPLTGYLFPSSGLGSFQSYVFDPLPLSFLLLMS